MLYPKASRQVGVLMTLGGTCASSTGQIIGHLYDADGAFAGVPLGTLTLGWNPQASSGSPPRTTDRVAFTSLAGHRYFLQVSGQSRQDVPYSASLAPTDALATRLVPTGPCVHGASVLRSARRRLFAVRAARERAHGRRRQVLRAEVQLHLQLVKLAQG